MSKKLELWIYDPRVEAWEYHGGGTPNSAASLEKQGKEIIKGDGPEPRRGWKYQVRESKEFNGFLNGREQPENDDSDRKVGQYGDYKVEQFNQGELIITTGDISVRISTGFFEGKKAANITAHSCIMCPTKINGLMGFIIVPRKSL